MRKHMVACAFGGVALVMVLGVSRTAQAGEGYWNGSSRKLGRGLANMVTAPMELLRESYLTGSKDGGIAGATVGVVRGIGSTIAREGAGIVEVLTFYTPAPTPDFQPMIKPEFVFANGNWAE